MTTYPTKRYFSVLLLLSIIFSFMVSSCSAPEVNPEEQAVIAVAQKLFDGMASKDVDALRSIFIPGGTVTSVQLSDVRVITETRTNEEMNEGLSTVTNEFLERMWDPTVMIYDRVATLWTHYDFHINGEFSHCGVDAFSFVKTSEGWKISGLTYTVQTEGCAESPLGTINGS